MKPEAAYQELLSRAKQQSLLASCAELLGWDEETYMPTGGVENRGNQLALLVGLHHQQAADSRTAELLDIVEGSSLIVDRYAPASVNIREWRRSYNRISRLPRSLIEEMARVTTYAQQQWVQARRNESFAEFRPWLEKIVALKMRESECLGYADCPYDALLEDYEPGVRSKDLDVLFHDLRSELVAFLGQIAETRRRAKVHILHRDYAIDRQRVFVEAVAAVVGYDFQRGRLDETTHPFFSTIGPGDCRITTRYNPNSFGDSFFGTLHEVGHALYEQGLDPEWHGTPMGEAVSLGMHEAQARLWENHVGRSRAFWRHFFPRARGVFHETLSDVSLEEFHFAINHVTPSLIRIQADEVTYNLHIMIRFELEKALISGDLRAADLPNAWDDAYDRYLGIRPKNDAEGCLQDGQWSAGHFGYFPTYALGNIYGAQLFERASADLGDLQGPFSRGQFEGLLTWLQNRVYREGQRHSSAELIRNVTGSLPDPRFLLRALRDKYHALYSV